MANPKWKSRDFVKLLKANGTNKITITVPTINGLIAKRLIKENDLRRYIK